MRFIDVNVFIYVFLRFKKELLENVCMMKEVVKEIFKRVSEGEEVVIIVVYFSEVVNVVESCVGKKRVVEIFLMFLIMENLKVFDVFYGDYLKVILIVEEKNFGINDVLVYVKMKEEGIGEIYIFDRDFEKFDIRVVLE